MYTALALKCWQEKRTFNFNDAENGENGARSGASFESRMLSNEGYEPEYILDECPELPNTYDGNTEADTCIFYKRTIETRTMVTKDCGRIDDTNTHFSRFRSEFQISQDECKKISGEGQNKGKYIDICVCSTDGCNEKMQNWEAPGGGIRGINGGIRKDDKLFPLAIVGFYLMKKIIDRPC